MGFWSTILAALRFRSSGIAVATEPLHIHRVRSDAQIFRRVRASAVKVTRIRNDIESVHRVHLEAR